MPAFPVVPQAPGVPPVFRDDQNKNLPEPAPLSSDEAGLGSNPQAPQWGIVDSGGNLVLAPDSVVAMDDFQHEFRVSDFPIEKGSFGSYNKVAIPFEGAFIFNKGGQPDDRGTFLDTLESLVADTKVYSFVVPEKSYENVNVVRYQVRPRRSENGYQLISTEVRLREIRVAASPSFSNTADPTQQSPQNGGAVQPQTPTEAQTAQAQGALNKTAGVGTLTAGGSK